MKWRQVAPAVLLEKPALAHVDARIPGHAINLRVLYVDTLPFLGSDTIITNIRSVIVCSRSF
jgi:hypothetical protein